MLWNTTWPLLVTKTFCVVSWTKCSYIKITVLFCCKMIIFSIEICCTVYNAALTIVVSKPLKPVHLPEHGNPYYFYRCIHYGLFIDIGLIDIRYMAWKGHVFSNIWKILQFLNPRIFLCLLPHFSFCILSISRLINHWMWIEILWRCIECSKK